MLTLLAVMRYCPLALAELLAALLSVCECECQWCGSASYVVCSLAISTALQGKEQEKSLMSISDAQRREVGGGNTFS